MAAGPVVEKIKEKFGDKLRVVVKFAPYPYRDYAKFAARAALAAHEQGKYWQMHKKLIEISPALDVKNLHKAAADLKLDTARFQKDFESDRIKARVEEDVALCRTLEIFQTPTFVINGRVVVGEREYEYMERVIKEELAAVGVK